MITIGLVLSAGGPVGDPWHAGALAALAEATGWDARRADLIVGTSAGAISAVGLRAGLSATDRWLDHLGREPSPEGRAVLDRLRTPWSEQTGPRDWRPQAPLMTLRSLLPPWRPRPVEAVTGLLPPGNRRADALAARTRELHPEPWPAEPTWIVAVRLDDGRRVVFGRDDVPGDLGAAVQASAAVPGVYAPVEIGSHRYVDGGIHSATNADLCAALAFDLVVVSSVMTLPAPGISTPWTREALHPVRARCSLRLADEVAGIRRRGTPVLVVQPSVDQLGALDRDGDPAEVRRRAAEAGHAAAHARLARRDGSGFVDLLRRAAADHEGAATGSGVPASADEGAGDTGR